VDPATYYPFEVSFCEGNVAEMATALGARKYNVIIYTSALEHMHPEAGFASLVECRKVVADNGLMVLTCPRTDEGADGYDTQYRAHVYEWKESELLKAFRAIGWETVDVFGLYAGIRDLTRCAEALGVDWLVTRLRQFVPVEWLVPVLAPAFPSVAKEIGYLLRPTKGE